MQYLSSTPALRHKPYGILSSLLPAHSSFINLIIDFIKDIPPGEYQDMVYDSIFLVMC